jgi:hypothetical protein
MFFFCPSLIDFFFQFHPSKLSLLKIELYNLFFYLHSMRLSLSHDSIYELTG